MNWNLNIYQSALQDQNNKSEENSEINVGLSQFNEKAYIWLFNEVPVILKFSNVRLES